VSYPVALKLLWQLKFYCSAAAREYHEDCVSLLKWEDGSDRRQVVIHIFHSELQFPSEVFLAYVTFIITVLMLLLLKTIRWL
jgi:hypothetical protein